MAGAEAPGLIVGGPSRCKCRSVSDSHTATLKPNVIGWACNDSARPIIGVSRCARASAAATSSQRCMRAASLNTPRISAVDQASFKDLESNTLVPIDLSLIFRETLLQSALP